MRSASGLSAKKDPQTAQYFLCLAELKAWAHVSQGRARRVFCLFVCLFLSFFLLLCCSFYLFVCLFVCLFNRFVGVVVRASASRTEDPGIQSRLHRDFFRGRVRPVTSKSALQWLPCQAPGVIGSVLGLVGPVSIYCDWVRWKVWSTNLYLSVAARKIVFADPSLACWWDVKQPTNKYCLLVCECFMIFFFFFFFGGGGCFVLFLHKRFIDGMSDVCVPLGDQPLHYV